MIKPHGGTLVNKLLPDIERQKIIGELNDFEKVTVDSETWTIIKNIAYGVFSPLEGFMNRNDTLHVLDDMYLESNIPWPFPIVLDVSKENANNFSTDDQIIITAKDHTPIALLKVQDIYSYDKKDFAQRIYGTLDPTHPGVEKTLRQENFLVGGEIFLISELPAPFPELDLKPVETRVLFKTRGWHRVVAFQTRNPPHLGHEYVQKAGLTFTDGLFINPVIGRKKAGDFLDEVIIDAYKSLIKNYYPTNRVVLSTFETEMRYAGPKEAIFHAIARKNFGCDYIIIGRDHAGVGNFYDPYDAHAIFERFPDLGIEPLFFRSFSTCHKCNSIVNDKICPHSPEYHKYFSGTDIRNIILSGKEPTPDIMRPEVAKVILKYANPFCQ